MIQWFKDNKEFLSIRGIEKHLKMPDSTLTKAVNGSQKLSPKWNDTLREFKDRLCGNVCECKFNEDVDLSLQCSKCKKKIEL